MRSVDSLGVRQRDVAVDQLREEIALDAGAPDLHPLESRRGRADELPRSLIKTYAARYDCQLPSANCLLAVTRRRRVADFFDFVVFDEDFGAAHLFLEVVADFELDV